MSSLFSRVGLRALLASSLAVTLLIAPATTASASTAAVDMAVSEGGSLIADGSTLAETATVTVGTSALLSPGIGQRELRTDLDAGTPYVAGSAVAPEGWAIQYSPNGTDWLSSEPAANTVRSVRATATAAAGAIDGRSQVYSSETTSSVPSSTFAGSSGGDGWDTFFFDDYVFNIYHHSDAITLICMVKSTGARCPAFVNGGAVYGSYRAGMRSGGWVDATTGKLYAFTSSTATNRAGVLCIDVANVGSSTTAPVTCGFTVLSTTLTTGHYNYLTEAEPVGRRLFGVAIDGNNGQLLCFDAATNAPCANTPIDLEGANYAVESTSNVRPLKVGSRIVVKTSTRLYCYTAATMAACSGTWPQTINAPDKVPLAPHTTTTGTLDGVCWSNGCADLSGTLQPSWGNPHSLTNNVNSNWAMHAVVGSLLGTRYIWAGAPLVLYCFDYATNAACGGAYPRTLGGEFNLIYSVRQDPENPTCAWLNSDGGRIINFDSLLGTNGCTSNPVITLQPNQFAPRYACSTTAGISQWTTLRLQSLNGGGAAGTITLTVRNAQGTIVPGWANVPVSLAQPLDMTGLDVALSGSRPTFSFAFGNITGSLTSAVIALDYKGAGPELCVRTTLSASTASDTSGTCPAVTVNGSMVDAGGTFTTSRSLRIATGSCAQNIVRQTVPGPVTNLTGTGLNTSATLRFTPPANTGGLPLLGFEVSRNGGSTWADAAAIDNGDGTYSAAITGLTAGTTYAMQVVAVNSLGRSTPTSLSLTAQRVTVDSLTDVVLSAATVTLETQTATGLPLTYTVAPASVCTVSANTITLVALGTCSVTANQAGNPNATPIILPAETTGSFAVLPVPATIPGTVTNLAVTPNSGQLELTWTAPANDGGAAIRDYQVQYKSGSTWIPYVDGVTAATGVVLTGLTNGTPYDLRVAAVNSAGQGAWASTISGTPRTVPGAVTSLAVSRVAGATSATLTFAAPANNGGSVLTDYVVEVKDNQTSTWTAFADGTATATSINVTGLNAATGYDFRVAAKNAAGNGAWTSTATLTASAASGALSLSWTTPLTGGETLLHFVPQYRAVGSTTWLDATSTSNTTFSLSGLTNGTSYEVRVAALTTSSTSSYTSLITATPMAVAGVVRNVTLTPTDRQLAVTWTAPAADGGATVSDYVVEYRTLGSTGAWTTLNDGISALTSAVITGLTNGTEYEVRIAAVNVQGTGSTSTPVTAKPRTTASAPATRTAVGGLGLMNVSWTAPLSDGGSAVTGYMVQYKTTDAGTWTTHASSVSGTSAAITGLAAGTTYAVRIAAITAAGTGAFTATASASTTVTATAGCSVAALAFTSGTRRRGDVAVTDPTRCYQRTATLGLDNTGRAIPAKLTIPSNSVAAAANFNIEVVSDPTAIASGLPAVSITAATASSAASVSTFDEPLEIELTGLSTALPAVSTDGGVTWRTLEQRSSAAVKALGPTGDGYSVAGNTFTIYTMHLTSFSLLDPTAPAPTSSNSGSANGGSSNTAAYAPINPMIPKDAPVLKWNAETGVLTCISPEWSLPLRRATFEWIGIDAKAVDVEAEPWETTVRLGVGFKGTVGCNVTAYGLNAVGTIGGATTIVPAAPVVKTANWTALKRTKLSFKPSTLTLSTVHSRQLRGVAKTAKRVVTVAASAAGRGAAAATVAKLRLALTQRALRSAGYTGRIVAKVVPVAPSLPTATVKLVYR